MKTEDAHTENVIALKMGMLSTTAAEIIAEDFMCKQLLKLNFIMPSSLVIAEKDISLRK